LFIGIIVVVVDDDVDSMSMSMMRWNAPTFLNTASAAIEVRAQMLLLMLLLLLLLLLPLLESLRDAFHPCVRHRFALGNEKARLRRLFIPREKLSVQPERSDKPVQIKQTQTSDIIQMP
jgi:hypothetical protein